MPIRYTDNIDCPDCGAGVDTVYGVGDCGRCGAVVRQRKDQTMTKSNNRTLLMVGIGSVIVFAAVFVYIGLRTSSGAPILPCELPTAVQQFHLQACPGGFSQ